MSAAPVEENPVSSPGERITRFLAHVADIPQPSGKIDLTMENVEALTDIAQVCRSALLTVAEERSCVLTVRVLDLVLAHYGVPGVRQAAVSVIALNNEAIPCAEEGRPVADWPEAAYSVGVIGSGAINGKDWDGHLVTVIRTTGNRIILDPSAGQFDRPRRNLHVPPVVCWRLPPVWTPHDPATIPLADDAGLIEYRLSTIKTWTEARDWNPDRPEVTAVVNAVVEAIDAVRRR